MRLIYKLEMRQIGKYKRRFGLFYCHYCNNEVEKMMHIGKKTLSCGYEEKQKKHGETFTRLYKIWDGMKRRCYQKNASDFKNYGGRGIKIYKKWKDDFVCFRDWALNNGYKENLTIDRINNDGNYEPNNCQWITRKNQNRKKSEVKLTYKKAMEIRGKYIKYIYTARMLAKEYNVKICAIQAVLENRSWLSEND